MPDDRTYRHKDSGNCKYHRDRPQVLYILIPVGNIEENERNQRKNDGKQNAFEQNLLTVAFLALCIMAFDFGGRQDDLTLLLLNALDDTLLIKGNACSAIGTLELMLVHIAIPPGEFSVAMVSKIVRIVLGYHTVGPFLLKGGTALGAMVFLKYHTQRERIAFFVQWEHFLFAYIFG